MTDWQHWVVALIVALCVWSIVKSIRSFFRRSRKGGNPCSRCSGGCSSTTMLRFKNEVQKS